MDTHKLVKEFNDTGPCILDIEELQKSWDHRYVLYQNDVDGKTTFRFIKFLRRGSEYTEVKCDVSNAHAKDIIFKLNLEQSFTMWRITSKWMKPGQSDFDMRAKPRAKKSK